MNNKRILTVAVALLNAFNFRVIMLEKVSLLHFPGLDHSGSDPGSREVVIFGRTGKIPGEKGEAQNQTRDLSA